MFFIVAIMRVCFAMLNNTVLALGANKVDEEAAPAVEAWQRVEAQIADYAEESGKGTSAAAAAHALMADIGRFCDLLPARCALGEVHKTRMWKLAHVEKLEAKWKEDASHAEEALPRALK